ncbi:hypothetical protein TELCIR_06852 [Teladorsagia circumcincta]|uniref:Uncharacterized protein n=1 Tax=Teladorsagia circumcincta TaxID=45464 RepID=A0A2G9UM73_TELCI|nr:hypothetical protein TELCIR_06852 [Teladorsagia circumcincta]
MTMMAFRRIYREIDEKDKSASHFIDVVSVILPHGYFKDDVFTRLQLLLTARQARDQEISRQLESETWVIFRIASSRYHIFYNSHYRILENFNALPQSTKDYLITKFPLLKYLKYSDSSFTGKPPGGLETSTPSQPSVTKTSGTSTSPKASTTKVSPMSSTTATPTTSQRLSIAEIKKLLEPAIKDLRDSRGKFKSIIFDSSPIENLLRKFLENPFSWSHGDYKKAFEQFKKSARKLSGICKKKDSVECEGASKMLASTLEQFIKSVAGLYPTNPKLKDLSSAYSSDISAASGSNQRLKIVLNYTDSKLF